MSTEQRERDIVERLVRIIYKHGYARGASDEAKDDFDPSREAQKYLESDPVVVRDLRAALSRIPTGEGEELDGEVTWTGMVDRMRGVGLMVRISEDVGLRRGDRVRLTAPKEET